MQTALIITLILCLVTVLVGIAMGIFARGRRMRGWLMASLALGGAAAGGVGLVLVADWEAQEAGYHDHLDQIRAAAAGIEDSAEWAAVRDQHAAAQALEDVQTAQDEAAGGTAPEIQEELECRKDLICWGERQLAFAEVYCTPEVERLARFSATWLDGWMEARFGYYEWLDKEAGTLTMMGDRLQFQNGFGAKVNMVYQCDIDPLEQTVLAVRVSEGRL